MNKMDKKISSSSNSTVSTKDEEETPIITLIPCDYDSTEEDDLENSSQNSIDSSEIADDSDEETEIIITSFKKLNQNSDEVDENTGKIITA